MAYTDKEEAVLTKAAEDGPITFAQAEELAVELCKTPRSVISKIKSMDLPYEPKPNEPKRPKGMTKHDLVESIKARLENPDVDLSGLEKATGVALGRLLEAL